MKKYLVLVIAGLLQSAMALAQTSCIFCFSQIHRVGSNSVTNLILNGGFEAGCPPNSVFCPNSLDYMCDIQNWTCTGGGPGTYAQLFDNNYSIIAEGQKVAYFGNSFCRPCSTSPDDTFCIQKNGCKVVGIPNDYPQNSPTFGGNDGLSLQQTITNLIPGTVYALEFWAGGEGVTVYDGLFAVDVGFGNIFFRCMATGTGSTATGTRYIVEFKATSSIHTIKFTNWGHISNYATELVLDDVRLFKAVELPSSFPTCILQLSEHENIAGITVYFDPTTSDLDIKVNQNTPNEITLYDIVGRKLQTEKFTANSSVNIQHLANGVYVYTIQNKGGLVKTGRFLKE